MPLLHLPCVFAQAATIVKGFFSIFGGGIFSLLGVQGVVRVLRCMEGCLSSNGCSCHVMGMDAHKDWEMMVGSWAKASTDGPEGIAEVPIYYLLCVVAPFPCGHIVFRSGGHQGKC